MQYPIRDDAFRNRLSTYGPNFPHCGVPADKLAEAGFRYDGISDQVHCDYCKGSLKSWKEGDCPLAEHKRHFHHCPFLKPLLSYPKHAEYSNLIDRINTFSSEQQNPTARDFSECGFFSHSAISLHSNESVPSDTVACFHCGITLARWSPDDDVWLEHAKVSKEPCPFLIKEKGLDFVLALRERQQNRNQRRSHDGASPRAPTPFRSEPVHPIQPVVTRELLELRRESPMHIARASPPAREHIMGESRSIGTSPIHELHRPIAIRSQELTGLASPLSSLSISGPPHPQFQPTTTLTEPPLIDAYPPRLLGTTPNPPPPPARPSSASGGNNASSNSLQLFSPTQPMSPTGVSVIPHQATSSNSFFSSERRARARNMTPPLPSSITTTNSSLDNPITQQIVPRGGNVRLRYTNPRRSPIQVSQNRISPYTVPRNNNPRTPEPLPEASLETSEADLRRMYVDLLRQRECKVCLSNLATVLFLPCGHLSACPACAPQLRDCHVCRATIASRHDIYPS